MLTTTGAQTGIPRTVPLLGFAVGGDLAVAAGNFGRTRDPAWCLNLRREPHASIVIGGEQRLDDRAGLLEGATVTRRRATS
jgi:deazaflavin-dependent oxidoreductase (nitroreductase family)